MRSMLSGVSKESFGRKVFAYSTTVKRAFDLTIAIGILPILVVSGIIVAPAIKLTDRGPVFHTGPRRGKSGVHYRMYKFRSMTVSSPDLRNADGSTFNSRDDNRVTPVGRVIRKLSIDELPQIINVLKGDMSFIGPRPDMTGRTWEELSELERKRLTVRPGITGLSQALFRNSISPAKRLAIDAYYVRNLSFGLDCRILLVTIKNVVLARNINGASVGRSVSGSQPYVDA